MISKKIKKENPERTLLMSRRAGEYYGTIINGSDKTDLLNSLHIFDIEIRKV